MQSLTCTAKRQATQELDENQPPVKRYKFENVDDIITRLYKLLLEDCVTEDEFKVCFSKLTKAELKPWQKQLLHESSPTGFNFLMLACKYGNEEAVKFLISCGLNLNKTNDFGLTASDYAWDERNLKCLIKLLRADAPYPQSFDLDSLEASDQKSDIIEIARKMSNFHKMIEADNLEELKLFVTQNPKTRYAYNPNNQCALTTALKSGKVDVYIFLRNHFFNAGIDSENHRDQLEKLDDNVKKYLQRKLKKHLKKPVVTELLSKSKDLSGKNYEKIVAFYETLNEIPEISPILELVAKSEKTEIVLDFDYSDIFVMDPTAMNSHGRTYHKSGHILIAAGREEIEVLGTLAHELTHWALQIVYNNKCQPFYADDDDRQNSYINIIDYASIDCVDHFSIISNVFKYNEKLWNAELIVRVPQLIATFKNNHEGLQKYRNACRLDELFEYYENEVLQDVKQEIELFDDKENIRKMNKTFGVFERLQNLNVLSSKCKKLPDTYGNMAIKTNLTDLVLEYIFKTKNSNQMVFNDALDVFVTKDDLLKAENLEMLRKAAESKVRPNFIIVDSGKVLDCQNIDHELAKSLEKLKIFYISTTHQTCFENFRFLKNEIDFTWNDLNDQAKAKLMNSKIIFQDTEVVLFEITDDESLLKEVPLEILLNLSSLNLNSLNKVLPKRPRVYVERKFEADEHISDDLCDLVSQHKTVLIADSAGMGKSTTAAQLARDLKAKNKSSWVVFIDLKKHTKVFFPDERAETEIVDASFFTEKLLHLQTRFESKLFESFYAMKNVVFIIDGFDEISPKYKKFVLNILQAIKNSENHLLVTTRPHFTTELEQRLETKAIHLLPLNKKDQIDFLTKFWNLESNDELTSRIILFLQKFKTDYFCATPIHIFMIAQVCGDQDLTNTVDLNTNLFLLYEKFIKIKLKIWTAEKGNLAKDDNVALQNTFPPLNCKTIFSRLAVEQIFSSKIAERLKIPKVSDEIIDETIARVGIVAFSSEGTAQFTHRTYAEFFVADLIASQAFKKNPKYEFVELFAEIILKTENFEQIWKFLNDKLKIMDDFDTEVLAKYFGRIVEKIEDWREIEDDDLDDSSIENLPSCSKLISFILEKLNLDDNFKKKLLIFFWKHFGDEFEYFSIIWSCAQKITDQKEKLLKELLFTDVRGFPFFVKALEHEWQIEAIESKRASKVVLEYAESSLNGKDFKKLFFDEEERNYSIELMIVDHFYFFKFWELAEKKLNKENLKKLALSKNWGNQTILNLIAENGEVLKWLQILKSLLTIEEFDEHLTVRDNAGNLFIGYAVQEAELYEIKSCLKFIEENSSLETQKKLLLSENKRGEILIEYSFRCEDESVVDFVFDITDFVLRKTEGKTLIDWLRDRDRLAHVICIMASFSNEFFDKYSSKLDAEEFRSLLSSKNSQNNTNVFHCFVHSRYSRSIQLWNRIVEKIKNLEATKVLLFEIYDDYDGNVFFHAALENNHFLIELLEWCKTTFDHEFIIKIFTEQDKDKRNLLHIVAGFGDENLNLKCLEFVSKNLEQQKQREMLRMKDKYEEFPIKISFNNRNQEVTDILAKFYENLFKKEELKEIICNCRYQYLSDVYKKITLENRWKA